MSLSTLIPIAGAAALAPVVTEAATELIGSLSFLDHLLAKDDEASVAPATRTSASKNETAKFEAKLLQRFATGGIDLSTPVRLRSNGHGGVLVDGDHSDRVLIETLFEQDPDLARAFHAAAAELAKQLPADESSGDDLTLVATARGLSLDVA